MERFNRTLKERLYWYFTAANTFRFDGQLRRLVEGCNSTRHHVIGMAPQDVTWNNGEAVWKRLYGKWVKQKPVRPKFQVEDRVRLNKVHRNFEKGYLPGWTEEVFLVHRVIRGPIPTYKIHEWDGSPVQGTFCDADLQKVQLEDDALFRTEKVLTRQKDRVLVKWKGWLDKYNSWISSRAITSSKKKKKEHDVSLVVFVLRDPHESRRHGRVSEQPTPSFQKPVAAPHSIRGSGLAGGVGQLVLALRPCRGGKLCRWQGSPVVRAMARTRVEHRRRPIVPLSSRTHRVGRTHVKRGLVVDGTTIFQSHCPTLRSRSNQSRR